MVQSCKYGAKTGPYLHGVFPVISTTGRAIQVTPLHYEALQILLNSVVPLSFLCPAVNFNAQVQLVQWSGATIIGRNSKSDLVNRTLTTVEWNIKPSYNSKFGDGVRCINGKL